MLNIKCIKLPQVIYETGGKYIFYGARINGMSHFHTDVLKAFYILKEKVGEMLTMTSINAKDGCAVS